jgi:hypothetical protein
MAARGPKPGGWVVVVTFRGDVVDRLAVPKWLKPDTYLRRVRAETDRMFVVELVRAGPTPDAPTREALMRQRRLL